MAYDKEYRRKYDAAHREEINAANRRYTARRREKVFSHYGKECACWAKPTWYSCALTM